MKCPHCNVAIHGKFVRSQILGEPDLGGMIGGQPWTASAMTCPQCGQAIIFIEAGASMHRLLVLPMMVYPKTTGRLPAPVAVPMHIADDYKEACTVLKDSPKASAALSRRCLQTVLRENGFPQKDLAPAIQAALDSNTLPKALAENVDAIRNIGNFAAHPLKDKNTGEILPVEEHEAEWNLDVLEELFDFYYTQPAKARERRAALDAKLEAAGKPPMKGASE
ncbi:DUF4145 domain-containing protein [Burkholderia ubonensis]|uniref:DUF4145 domain-containing protein n=1 Tax=Burkholderia ubonensis TaxID=101571 RepID=UPI001E32D197|nr:DUF4145 domain-containing protein [Burkholderia ubonensis]